MPREEAKESEITGPALLFSKYLTNTQSSYIPELQKFFVYKMQKIGLNVAGLLWILKEIAWSQALAHSKCSIHANIIITTQVGTEPKSVFLPVPM